MIRLAVVFGVLTLVFGMFVAFEQVATVLNTLFWVFAFLFAFSLLVSVFGWRFPSACGRGSGQCTRF